MSALPSTSQVRDPRLSLLFCQGSAFPQVNAKCGYGQPAVDAAVVLFGLLQDKDLVWVLALQSSDAAYPFVLVRAEVGFFFVTVVKACLHKNAPFLVCACLLSKLSAISAFSFRTWKLSPAMPVTLICQLFTENCWGKRLSCAIGGLGTLHSVPLPPLSYMHFFECVKNRAPKI